MLINDRIRKSFSLQVKFGIALFLLFAFGVLIYPLGGFFNSIGFSAVAVSVCAAFFYFIWVFSVKTGLTDCARKMLKLSDWIVVACIIFAVLLYTLIFLISEEFVYYWDYGSYWVSTQNLADTMQSDLCGALTSTFIVSINVMSYNAMISAFMVVPLLIGGETYEAFYFFVCLLFYVPASFIFSVTIQKFVLSCGRFRTIFPFWVTFLAVILMGIGLVPILNGYVDAFCLLPLAVLIYTAFEHRYRVFNGTDTVITVVCLLLIAFGRRYFLYFILGFVAAVVCVNLADLVLRKIRNRQVKGETAAFIENMLLTGGICVVLLSTLYLGFTLLSLLGNYQEAYSAYSVGSIVANLQRMFQMYGVIPCVLSLLGVVALLYNRKIYELTFMLLSLTVTSLFFAMVQAPGQQHLYIVYFQFAALSVAGLCGIYAPAVHFAAQLRRKILTFRQNAGVCRAENHALPRAYTVSCSVVLSLIMALQFACITVLGGTAFATQMTSSNIERKMRGDIRVLEELTDYLYDIVGGTGAQIYCIGSGEVFNDDIMRKLYMPDVSKISSNLASVSHVDLRDGFPVSFLTADVVVTSTPCEYHLGETNQRVVSVLNNAIIGESPLNNNFTEKESFQLDKGIVATVWVRTVPFEKEDIDYLAEIYAEYYPDYPELFETRIKIFA